MSESRQPSATGGDSDARRRIAGSLEESLIVEAAAGTGKTSELVGRIVAMLGSGHARDIDGIVAVTFTRKAAGELKLRLRQALDTARTRSSVAAERERLERALAGLEAAHIGTIHGFSADILRQRPVEAGIQPGFEELDESEAPRLFQRVFRRWAEMTMSAPPPGVGRALDRAATLDAAPTGRSTPLAQIRNAAWRLIEWRDFPEAWGRRQFDRDAEIDGLVGAVADLAHMAQTCPDPKDALRQALQPAVDFNNRVDRLEAVRDRHYDEMEAAIVGLERSLEPDKRKGRGRFSERVGRDQVLEARRDLLDRLARFRVAADADLAAALKDELRELVDLYDDAKRRAGKLDFVDLLLATRDLLRDNAGVRAFFQRRFTHLFVDEFQDTDPLQAEILLLLAADDPDESDWMSARPVPGKLFLVGDPKQSIYRFRRADVVLYRQLREGLTARGVGLVFLTRSFRAVPGIQQMVNAAFAPEMDGDSDTGQPHYVALEHHAAPIPRQPAVIALSLPRPYGWNRVTKTAVNRCLPPTVGAFVQWLLDRSGWVVRSPDSRGEPTPIAPRHVCILFRRFTSWGSDLTRDYVHELEARRVPHLLWGAKSFHRREEVEGLRAAFTAIEWPEDELSVYATLKGSLFAIPDDVLLRYRKEVGRLHPFRADPDGPDLFAPVRQALDTLARLHRKRNWRPFVETVNDLLATTRAHAGFALRPAGNQVLANVYRVADMARAFETGGGVSFRGFVNRLTSEADFEEATESPVLEDGAEGVRIMTVHAAKGLEFPVVILADITANLAPNRPDKHVDAERKLAAMRLVGCTPWDLVDTEERERLGDGAEGIRVAYVAATRARDLLVVPAVGDEPVSGWVGALNRALYPARGQERQSSPADGCPAFGDDSVLDRPPSRMDEVERSVRPGRHRAAGGGHDVVWWDPSTLTLEVPGIFGIRHEDILRPDLDRDAAQRSVQDYEEWRRRRAATIERGRIPALEVSTATEATDGPPAGGGEDAKAAVNVVMTRRDPNRPSGPRFGTLVHLLLQDSPFDADSGRIATLARFHARVLAAPDPERAAAVHAVEAALGHPLIERARRAQRAHREYPVTLRTGEKQILEGVIDLAFLESGVWNVVDFKTDIDLSPHGDRYQRQVAWYCFAITELTGLPARGHLFAV